MKTYREWLINRGEDPDALSADQQKTLRAEYNTWKAAQTEPTDPPEPTPQPAPAPSRTEPTPPTPPAPVPAPAPVADEEAARQAEKTRQQGIRELATQHDLDDELVRTAIDGDHTVERFQVTALEAIRDARGPSVGGGGLTIVSRSSPDDNLSARALQDALCLRAGGENAILVAPTGSDSRQAQERRCEMAAPYRDASLIDMCREALRAADQPVTYNNEDMIRAAFSTSNLTFIFSQTMEALLMMKFMEAPATWRSWTRVRTDIANYKTNERTGVTERANLKRTPRGKSAPSSAIDEFQETYKLGRFADSWQIDDMDIIDDRFDVFADTPGEMAIAAARLPRDIAYSLLLANAAMSDGNNLFDNTNHGNNTSGAAYSQTVLRAMLQAIVKQRGRGVDKAKLGVQAAVHLVPPAHMHDAATFLNSSTISNDSGTGSANPIQILHRNLILEIEPCLELGVTDPRDDVVHSGSATATYLAANPGAMPTVEIGFLAGTNGNPRLRSERLAAPAFGQIFTVEHSAGGVVLAWEGLHKDDGA